MLEDHIYKYQFNEIWIFSGEVRGFEVDVIEILSDKFGFNFSLVEQSAWGIKLPGYCQIATRSRSIWIQICVHLGPSNAWIGTVGAVKNKTSTMGIGILKMNQYFYSAVDFIGPIGAHEVKITQRRPRPLKPHWVSLKLVAYCIHS